MIHHVQIESGYKKYELNNVKLVYIQNIQTDETVKFTYIYCSRHVCQLINFILKIEFF
jgi:hypothetical protein